MGTPYEHEVVENASQLNQDDIVIAYVTNLLATRLGSQKLSSSIMGPTGTGKSHVRIYHFSEKSFIAYLLTTL